jgi:pyridoxamine 5'-phosphate oxidase
MTRSEILDFVRKSTTSFMATVENGEPRVRGMDTPHVDEHGLTFCTGSRKQVCLQLLANPSVELCYWNQEEGVQLRLRGRMEILDDEALKQHIVETRFTFLKPVVERFGWGSLTLLRLGGGQASLWSARNTAGGSEEFPF